jgi:hypothetical protein
MTATSHAPARARTGGAAGARTRYDTNVTGMVTAGPVVVSIPANTFTDIAGNPNTEASTSTDHTVQWKPA